LPADAPPNANPERFMRFADPTLDADRASRSREPRGLPQAMIRGAWMCVKALTTLDAGSCSWRSSCSVFSPESTIG